MPAFSMTVKTNPDVVLREEFDDWAILFHPDTAEAFGINPVGVFIWKHLDGKHSLDDISASLAKNFENVPNEARIQLADFIENLRNRGLIDVSIEDAGQ